VTSAGVASVNFYEIEFPLASLNSDAVEAALTQAGASSITFLDRGDEPILEPKPGEIRLWSDTLVRALFQESADSTRDALKNLQELSGSLGAHVTETARIRAVEEQAWERVWLKDWKPMRFGRRLWVVPSSSELPQDPDAVVVLLDPGLAFGTGTHPTTAVCLQVLDSLPLEGRSVIDYGCGSGILGIAAIKLGAASVVAVDIDEQALLATRENASRNQVSDRMSVQNIQPPLPAAYCVVANILAGPLVELAPLLTAACEPRGYLLLSGLLKQQAYEVKAAYAAGFDMVQVIDRDDWCCIYARRAS
jgi:ribosomal protein L11 methyltransferase